MLCSVQCGTNQVPPHNLLNCIAAETQTQHLHAHNDAHPVWKIRSVPALFSEHHRGNRLHHCTVNDEEGQWGQHCRRHESSRRFHGMQLLGGLHQYDATAEKDAHNVEEVVLHGTKSLVIMWKKRGAMQ